MTLAIKRYKHKPLFVEAVQVTRDNMAEVAEWCGGTLQVTEEEKPRKYILVATIRPNHERQTWAFMGDWVLKTDQGWKIYNKKSFSKGFDLVVEPEPRIHLEISGNPVLGDNGPAVVLHRVNRDG